jgi:gliding motility-associated-like protein
MPQCPVVNLDEKDSFLFRFMVIDNANKCRFYKADTLLVRVLLQPPDNEPPALSVISANPEHSIINNALVAYVGSTIQLILTATDTDVFPTPDQLTIELIEASGSVTPSGYAFNPATGTSPLTTTFTWNTDCRIFQNSVYVNFYTLRFIVRDDRCFNRKADTLAFNLTIRDIEEQHSSFLPPNFFSPNGDAINDYYGMLRFNELTGETENLLPPDNCEGQFVSIRIFNRWGKEVFFSRDRNFRWYGEGLPSGVYFYLLKYTHRDYRGTITLRY